MGDLSCFVIGPIGDRLAEYGTDDRKTYEDSIQIWERVISPACAAVGIEPLRADNISRTGEILEQVCIRLLSDNLVIADLTGANPNVMYELGLRHTVNKLTIPIGERGRLPFDVSAIRTIQFTRTESGLIEARDELIKAIRTGLEDGADPVTATRVWNESSIHLEHYEPEGQEEVDTIEQAPGFLEMLADAETGMGPLPGVIQSMSTTIQEIGGIARLAGEEAVRSDAAGAGAGAKLAIVNRAAGKLSEKAIGLEESSIAFDRRMAQIHPGISYIIDRLEAEPDLRIEATGFVSAITGFGDTIERNEVTFGRLRESLKSVGQATRPLRTATERISEQIARFISSAAKVKEWRDRLSKL